LVVGRLRLRLPGRPGETHRRGVLALVDDGDAAHACGLVADVGDVTEVLAAVLVLAGDVGVVQGFAQVCGLVDLELGPGALGRVAVAGRRPTLSRHHSSRFWRSRSASYPKPGRVGSFGSSSPTRDLRRSARDFGSEADGGGGAASCVSSSPRDTSPW